MKKKILYFFDYGISYGGAVNTLLHQMLLIREAGYNIKAYISNNHSDIINKQYLDIFYKHGIDVHYIGFTLNSYPEEFDIIDILNQYDSVRDEIKKERPWIVHSVQINPTVELACRELNVPHIMNIYQSDDDFFRIKYIDIFPHFQICDSYLYAKKWSEGLGIYSLCIRTVVDKYNVRNKIERKDSLIFITVGLLCERKNQLEIIKGFHKALKKQLKKAKLYLYGIDTSEYAEKCKQYVRDNELEDKIFFMGFCQEMQKVYDESDVLICGSRVESYPNVISEALANGVIIISTPVAGVPEVLIDCKNGYLTEGYTSDDFCLKILNCLNDFKDGSVNSILNNANNTFQMIHESEAVKKQIVNYYEYVAKNDSKKDLLLIQNVENEFKKVIYLYKCHEDKYIDKSFVRNRLWYWINIQKNMNNAGEKRIYIWGAGKIGRQTYEMVKSLSVGKAIEGFIDSSKNGNYMGVDVYGPDDILKQKDVVILVAVRKYHEIEERLINVGKRYGKDYYLMVSRDW